MTGRTETSPNNFIELRAVGNELLHAGAVTCETRECSPADHCQAELGNTSLDKNC